MRRGQINYSQEELEFIKSNSTLPRKELTFLFNQKFNRDLNWWNIKTVCRDRGWKAGQSGRFKKGHLPHPNARPKGPNKTSFKKGQSPVNTKPLWSEAIRDGYIWIKVPIKNPYTGSSTWYVLKQRWVWEQANGKIPKGYCICFIDGNSLNCSIENLDLVSRQELVYMNKLQHNLQSEELRPVIRTLSKLTAKMHNLKRGTHMADIRQDLKSMLQQATELQDSWTPSNGDTFIQDDKYWTIGNSAFYYCTKSSETVLESVSDGIPVPTILLSGILNNFEVPQDWIDAERIWYPSIEQLQNKMDMKQLELTLFHENNLYYCRVKSSIYKVHDEYFSALTSSILWLQLFMYIQHKKYWNEEGTVWQTKKPEEL